MEGLTNAMVRLKERLLAGVVSAGTTTTAERERNVLLLLDDGDNRSNSHGTTSRRCCTTMRHIGSMSCHRRNRIAVGVSVVTLAGLLISIVLLLGITVVDPASSTHNKHSSTGGGELSFPTMDDTLEMARLSNLIYEFHDVQKDDIVCAQINAGNYSNTSSNNATDKNDNDSNSNSDDTDTNDINTDWHCHWYRHERAKQGTQVMLLSSRLKNFIAIVFAGTNDVRTSLTDADILTQPFGTVSCSSSSSDDDSDNDANKTSIRATSSNNAAVPTVTTKSAATTNWSLPPNEPGDDGDDDDQNKKHSANDLRNLVKIHAGFDNAVFCQGDLFSQLFEIFDSVYQQQLQQEEQSQPSGRRRWSWPWWRRHKSQPTKPPLRLFATGHSLGAAASVLTAVALTDHYVSATTTSSPSSSSPSVPFYMKVINFGCPQMGNTAWRDYVNDYSILLKRHLSIWRVVLGYDLVPRLPQLSFYHVGHTVQLSHDYEQEIKEQPQQRHDDDDSDNRTPPRDNKLHEAQQQQARDLKNRRLSSSSSSNSWKLFGDNFLNNTRDTKDDTSKSNSSSNSSSSNNDGDGKNQKNSTDDKQPLAVAYYHHYGNETLGYAGIPLGWSSLPYIWVPGAVESHHITHYIEFLQALQHKQQEQQQQQQERPPNHTTSSNIWITKFAKIDDDKKKKNNGNDDERPPNVDDDFWDNPPDEEAVTATS